jgi:hypothetical protein
VNDKAEEMNELDLIGCRGREEKARPLPLPARWRSKN